MSRLFVIASLVLGAKLPLCAAGASGDYDRSDSPLRPLIERFAQDRQDLTRYYSIRLADDRRERMRRFFHEREEQLTRLDFDRLNQDGKVDYILLHNFLEHALSRIDWEEKQDGEAASFLPFAQTIIRLEEARRSGQPIDAQASAASLTALKRELDSRRDELKKPNETQNAGALAKRRVNANHAAGNVDQLRRILSNWYRFYGDYDPLFTWWNKEAWQKADAALENYARFLRHDVAGIKTAAEQKQNDKGEDERGENFNLEVARAARPGDTSDIIGYPIGREQLLKELTYEMIPYTPEELIAVARKEFAWCEAEMRRASHEMGYGDDWKKALEKVKSMYVAPGKQPQLIRDLEQEAEAFVDQHELVTIPPIARETWRMQMMSPERQLINPFFTGGETISVSYPTAEMTYEQKLMSMRGNNIPFSRATVFHELIPGHELQLYMADRYHAYRKELGSTPFTIEGWSLYWELLFWDLKFQKTPEDRIGALFWRMHRCARIIFSLSFHLGQMTPDECVNFLVDRVGHERENAIAEVRRSVAGKDGPLYQAAYLLGGMQFYALHTDLVGGRKMTNRQFNDAVLRENMMPVELIRASLTGQKLTRNYHTSWKFLSAGPIPGT